MPTFDQFRGNNPVEITDMWRSTQERASAPYRLIELEGTTQSTADLMRAGVTDSVCILDQAAQDSSCLLIFLGHLSRAGLHHAQKSRPEAWHALGGMHRTVYKPEVSWYSKVMIGSHPNPITYAICAQWSAGIQQQDLQTWGCVESTLGMSALQPMRRS